jgi:hypothetical protein
MAGDAIWCDRSICLKGNLIMRFTYRKSGRWLRWPFALLFLLLSACAPGNADATPTLSVEAIYTAAYHTAAAQQATQLALTPPTNTPPPPTEVPTLPPAPLPTFSFSSPTAGSSIGGGSSLCDSAAFVADVTIPDNTTVNAGKTFTKTWTLLNNGTCTWSSGYSLAFQSGDQMNGANVALANSVGPGSSINISVKLTAPDSNGTYKGVWRMENASGQAFGDTPWVIIKVGGGATATPGPSPTSSTSACSAGVCTITVTSSGVAGNNFIVTIKDISKKHLTECATADGTLPCSFTVPAHWDGTVQLSKGSYTFDDNPRTLTDVSVSKTINFVGHAP